MWRLLMMIGLVSVAATAAPTLTRAHEFSLGIIATGTAAEARVIAAVRGALLAADERDAHPDETSDGHLGGLDVQLVPLPDGSRLSLPELKNVHQGPLDLVLVLDDGVEGIADVPGVIAETLVFQTGIAPAPPGQGDFAARYRSAWGNPPNADAVSGYNAARRLDLAIRPHDGVGDKAALRRSLERSANGIAW